MTKRLFFEAATRIEPQIHYWSLWISRTEGVIARGTGRVAEWLRRGLQILASRFDSGRGLQPHQFFTLDVTLLALFAISEWLYFGES